MPTGAASAGRSSASAGVVAAWGLVDIYAVPLQFWRDSGVPGWFSEQLGLDYGQGLSGLPENWVYNLGDERPLRRLVSTFLSPLATAYMLLVAILLAATWQRSRWLSALTGLLAVGLFFTYSRTSIAALVVGLVALAYGLRSWWPVAAAFVFLAAAFFFVRAYPDIAPETRYTAGRAGDPAGGRPRGADERRRVRPGRVVVRQPPRQPPRGDRDRRQAPAGLRARQLRRDCEADGDGDQGRRVDLHGAGRRAGAPRDAGVHRLEPRAAARRPPASPVARCFARRRARARRSRRT